MQWIENYDLFLFDFDGLLVDTERLHYRAYLDALKKRNFHCDWDFRTFCSLAHHNATALKEALCGAYPLEASWESFYEEKKVEYLALLKKTKVAWMPGVKELLLTLEKKKIPRCVVTNSPQEQIDLIREKSPTLQTIPHWITRHQYQNPKPDPECYQLAITQLATSKDRVIGFEDSLRGFEALSQTRAKAVLICPEDHPLLQKMTPKPLHFSSFQMIKDL